jgi:hypothetical protein
VIPLVRLVGGEGPGDDEATGRDALQTFSGVVAMYVTWMNSGFSMVTSFRPFLEIAQRVEVPPLSARRASRRRLLVGSASALNTQAPIAEVWQVFSTGEGFTRLGVARAEMDFRPGGLIRSTYDAANPLDAV